MRHAKEGAKGFYDKTTFTPEGVRKEESIPWSSHDFLHGGSFHPIRYKEITKVLWRKGAQRRTLRCIVMAPTGYRLQNGDVPPNGPRAWRSSRCFATRS